MLLLLNASLELQNPTVQVKEEAEKARRKLEERQGSRFEVFIGPEVTVVTAYSCLEKHVVE